MTNRINIGGANRPVKFGFNALAEFCSIHKVTLNDVSQIATNIDLLKARDLCYVGLKYGAKSEGEQFAHTTEDVGDWLEDDYGLLTEIIQIFGTQLSASTNKKKQAQTQAEQ